MGSLRQALCLVVWTLIGALNPRSMPRRATGEQILAIYLPGVYFARLEDKVRLGNRLVTPGEAPSGLGDERLRLTPQVYATQEALDADAARTVLLLAVTAGHRRGCPRYNPSLWRRRAGGRTRLVVLTSGAIRVLSDFAATSCSLPCRWKTPGASPKTCCLRQAGAGARPPGLGRDVGSLLSLRCAKADAILLYEDDAAQAQKAGLRSLYVSAALPRPTLAVYERRLPGIDLSRLR